MSERAPLHLFEGYGIEIEYMIVDRTSLAVAPVADDLIARAAGSLSNEIERGAARWSNELVLHVIEFKSNGPLPTLGGAAHLFAAQVRDANALLASHGRMLLPTGMHPWMDPGADMHLWPHDDDVIYRTLHRIFDCRGHGWANLQSIHVNLPFCGDLEFARLHAAIRVLLPVLPALAASTPIMDGRVTGVLDNRLAVYRDNCARVPSVTGQVIPESVVTPADYRSQILEPMWRDIAPLDPDAILREEWLNARGAIARFDRMAIEIRVLDVQENPCADLALATLVCAAVRALTEERWCDLELQQKVPQEALVALFDACVRDGDRTRLNWPGYAGLFALPPGSVDTAGELWGHLVQSLAASGDLDADTLGALGPLLEHGCLARRMLTALGDGARADQERVFRQLAACLAENRPFL